MSEKDGGAAFPSHGTMGEVVNEGMSLRDFLAAAALTGLASFEATNSREYQFAKLAYRLADAMLRARAHTEGMK